MQVQSKLTWQQDGALRHRAQNVRCFFERSFQKWLPTVAERIGVLDIKKLHDGIFSWGNN
jgi:hypothetical protein